MPLRPLIALVAFLVIFVVSVALHGVYLRVHKHHARPVFHAVRRSPWHLAHSLIVAIMLINPILFAGVALFVARYGGAAPLPTRRAIVHLTAGGARPSLIQYLPPGLDQGSVNACVGFATTTALWIEARERGDAPPFDAYSGFYDYWYASGGRNVPTTISANVLAEATRGLVSRQRWGVFAPPPYSVQSAAREYGASYRYLDGTLAQTERAIDEGYAPVIMLHVRDGFYNAFAQGVADDVGWFHFDHAVTALAYRQDGSVLVANWWSGWGIGQTAWLTPRSWSQVFGVAVVAPGQQAYSVVKPLAPLPPVKPVATPKPIPMPSRVPVASHRPPQRSTRPTRPTPPRRVLYTFRATHALRNAPFVGSRHLTVMLKGWQVRGTGQVVHGWRRVVELSRKHVVGWAYKDWLKP